jgi:RiboL-PSP-HEPN
MKPQKLIIKKLLDKGEKLEFHYSIPSWNLSTLEIDFLDRESLLEDNSPAISLYVVGIISCIEASVRSTIKEMIDSGSPYLERVVSLDIKIEFDFEMVQLLQNKKLTIGDFISSLVSISSIENIDKIFSRLLDVPLKDCLRNIKTYVEPDPSIYYEDIDFRGKNYRTGKNIVNDPNQIFAELGKLFSQRHVVAHEGKFDLFTKDELKTAFQVSQKFLEAVGEIFEERIYPDVPRSSLGASLYALREAGESRQKMETLYEELQKAISSSSPFFGIAFSRKKATSALKRSRNSFEAFLIKEIEFEVTRNGTMLGNSLRFLEATISKELYEFQIQRLENLLKEYRFLTKLPT